MRLRQTTAWGTRNIVGQAIGITGGRIMNMFVKIIRNGQMAPGKLADAELHFTGGELDGLKLIGFSIWARRDGTGQNVTLPARQFTAHGQRRSFSLLRAINDDPAAQERVRDFVLQAYQAHAQHVNEVNP
jgi:hypothetical protein